MAYDQRRFLISLAACLSLCVAGSTADGGSSCLDCGLTPESSLRVIPAHCSVNYHDRSIGCSVDSSVCERVRCNASQSCISILRGSGYLWNFTSLCFGDLGHCKPKPFPDHSSFPPSTILCSCNRGSCLQQDGILNYFHPNVSDGGNRGVTLTTVPPLPPSPTITISGGHDSPVISSKVLMTIVVVMVLPLILAVVLVCVTVMMVVYWQRRERHRQYSHKILRNETL